jgi:UTP--glucose-1-phosphate uridylyltransferase
VIDHRDPLLSRMLEVRAEQGGSVVALMPVDEAHISMYGVAAVEATAEPDLVRVTALVEKPSTAEAPSRLAVIGRYVLDPAIFPTLAETEPGRGGEIQLTDGINALAGRTRADGGVVHGVIFTGRRYDTGDRAEYLRTIVRFAAERPDLGPDFLSWLRDFLAEHDKIDDAPVSSDEAARAGDLV